MYTTSGGNNHKKDYYCCRSKKVSGVNGNKKSKCISSYIQRDIMENTITHFISEKLINGDYVKKMVKLALSNEQYGDNEVEADNLKKQIEDIGNKRQKYLGLYGKGLYTEDELSTEVAKLNEDCKLVQNRLDKCERDIMLRKNIQIEKIPSLVSALSQFVYWNPSQKREFLRSQMPEFSVTKDGVQDVTLSFCKLGTRMDRGSSPLQA